ncbi:hypothetical protein KKF61_07615 [Patescibacteria group bacterium]|nr:hypothetical protein [Patescibacteria group bacterium]
MKIPDTLKILGREIRVEQTPDLAHEHDDQGQAKFRIDSIRLQAHTPSVPRTPQGIAITFLHEILHWLLFLNQEDKVIQDNEALVARLSEGLYQVLHDNQLRF